MSQRCLNLIKLCVGVDEPAQLRAWQTKRMAETGNAAPVHVTRMWPKRGDELLDGGSIYWVMRGLIRARQRIAGLQSVTGSDGLKRCAIQLDPELVLTEIVPRRPFQGWRYLQGGDAPADLLSTAQSDTRLPVDLQTALAEIGVR